SFEGKGFAFKNEPEKLTRIIF
ncbi:hypothetical protein LCGC14_1480110, partial [marine sediment metagenome]